jgi:hypothetical protein
MEDGNGNVVSVEKVVDKKELAKQRKAFLARERRHAEKLIRERRKQIEFVVVDRESENIIEGEAVKKIVVAKQRKVLLQVERRNALKRPSSEIRVEEEDYARKQKRNEARNERYDPDKRHAQYDEDKEREKIDNDAQRFRDYVDGHLVFDVCAIVYIIGNKN